MKWSAQCKLLKDNRDHEHKITGIRYGTLLNNNTKKMADEFDQITKKRSVPVHMWVSFCNNTWWKHPIANIKDENVTNKISKSEYQMVPEKGFHGSFKYRGSPKPNEKESVL